MGSNVSSEWSTVGLSLVGLAYYSLKVTVDSALLLLIFILILIPLLRKKTAPVFGPCRTKVPSKDFHSFLFGATFWEFVVLRYLLNIVSPSEILMTMFLFTLYRLPDTDYRNTMFVYMHNFEIF